MDAFVGWNMLNEFNNGIKVMFKEFFNKGTNKKQRANMWTFSRLILAFLVPIMALIGKITIVPFFYALAVGFTTLGAFTDFMDGRSARKHNSMSMFGRKLDILADKVFSFMQAITLSLMNPLFLFNIMGEAMISFTNIHYQKKYSHLVPKSSNIGRIKQWPLSIAFILGYLSIFLPELVLATNIFIFISFAMELAVFKNYVDINNYSVREYHKTCSFTPKEEVIDSKEKTLKDEYLNLRNVLIEIRNIKEIENEKAIVKVRKRQS